MSESFRRSGGPIPLILEEADRKWLRDEARALNVQSSEVAAYLIRAARLSTLSAMTAGKALVAVGKERDAEAEPEPPADHNPLFDELDEPEPTERRESRQPPAMVVPDGWDTKRYATAKEAIEAATEHYLEDSVGEVNQASPSHFPVKLEAFRGLNPQSQARPDIVSLRPVGSLTRPAGLAPELQGSEIDNTVDAQTRARREALRRNNGHLIHGIGK